MLQFRTSKKNLTFGRVKELLQFKNENTVSICDVKLPLTFCCRETCSNQA